MKRFLYLFFALIIVSSFIFAANFDNNIYVNPFIFGVIKGDDGQVLNPINVSSFLNGKLQTFDAPTPSTVGTLDVRIYNNKVLILKSSSFNTLKQNTVLHKFFINYKTVEYPNKNINALFKWS